MLMETLACFVPDSEPTFLLRPLGRRWGEREEDKEQQEEEEYKVSFK